MEAGDLEDCLREVEDAKTIIGLLHLLGERRTGRRATSAERWGRYASAAMRVGVVTEVKADEHRVALDAGRGA